MKIKKRPKTERPARTGKKKRSKKQKIFLALTVENDQICVAVRQGRETKEEFFVDLPEDAWDGHLKSKELFASLLKAALKERKVKKKETVFTLPRDQVFVRAVTMPRMSDEKLLLNLPYEFRDDIGEDTDDYTFDYEYLPPFDGNEESETVELMGSAVRSETLYDYLDALKMAGLKIKTVAPERTWVLENEDEDQTVTEENEESGASDGGDFDGRESSGELGESGDGEFVGESDRDLGFGGEPGEYGESVGESDGDLGFGGEYGADEETEASVFSEEEGEVRNEEGADETGEEAEEA